VPLILRYVLRTPREETIVGEIDQFVRRQQHDDSWRPMAAARAYMEQQPGSDLYAEIFFRRHIKFQYPPTSLLLVDHLSRRALDRGLADRAFERLVVSDRASPCATVTAATGLSVGPDGDAGRRGGSGADVLSAAQGLHAGADPGVGGRADSGGHLGLVRRAP